MTFQVVRIAIALLCLTVPCAARADEGDADEHPRLLTAPRSSLRYASGTYYEIAWEGGASPFHTASGEAPFGTALRIRENDHILTKLAFVFLSAAGLQGRPDHETSEARTQRQANNEQIYENAANAGGFRTATELLLYSDTLGGQLSGFELREYFVSFVFPAGPSALVLEVGAGGGWLSGPVFTPAPNQAQTLHTRFGPVAQLHATIGRSAGVFLRAEPNLAGLLGWGPAQHPVAFGAQFSPFEQLFIQGQVGWAELAPLPSGWTVSAGVRL